MKTPFQRTPYNYDTADATNESALQCKDPSLTQQSFTEESDINFIAERFGLGQLDPALWQQAIPNVLNPPTYGDFTGVFDFQQTQNAVRSALEGFMLLPAKLRTRFDNDPQKLIAFLNNPENRAEAEFMGILKTPPEPLQSPPGQEPPGPKGNPTQTAQEPPPGAKT